MPPQADGRKLRRVKPELAIDLILAVAAILTLFQISRKYRLWISGLPTKELRGERSGSRSFLR